ncbi:3-ketoacyl-CoA synthase 9-like [Pyrus ussuriensis x Pyrus communis]|uniref:3-ketoacyl-CoA synthase 9-like n=1 Tax=Pyrus ussuriensis x Pyrus communis TaxID=2448454 RepID=A0A5N5I599_9ROSA|nr:3-ketoacyl-CoA synthase 9-like [Pyrus ussuriensis x Pyrus communis]
MEVIHSLRTHHGASDRAYKASFQEEDYKGNTGVALAKDLIAVAGMSLREHIKILAPRVLPLSQLGLYVYSVICSALSGSKSKPIVPDFTKAFDHFCIHTGGKAVIEQVERVLRLGDELTEPTRMTLHRFGNTSSSLVFYELRILRLRGGSGKEIGCGCWRLGQISRLEVLSARQFRI